MKYKGRNYQYPRMSCQLNDKMKLCEDDKIEIRKLRKSGLILKEIANKFNVSIPTIYWVCNKKAYLEQIERMKKFQKNYFEEHGEYRKRKIKDYNKKYWQKISQDKDYYKKITRYQKLYNKKNRNKKNARKRKRYKEDPEYRKKQIEKTKEWAKKNKDKVRSYYKKNRKKLSEYSKKWRKSEKGIRYVKKYADQNREQKRLYDKEYYKKRKKNGR